MTRTHRYNLIAQRALALGHPAPPRPVDDERELEQHLRRLETEATSACFPPVRPFWHGRW